MKNQVNEKVARYRSRMKDAGMRPIQIWVPDTRQPKFSQELSRQIKVLQNQPEENAALDFIETEGLAEVWE